MCGGRVRCYGFIRQVHRWKLADKGLYIREGVVKGCVGGYGGGRVLGLARAGKQTVRWSCCLLL